MAKMKGNIKLCNFHLRCSQCRSSRCCRQSCGCRRRSCCSCRCCCCCCCCCFPLIRLSWILRARPCASRSHVVQDARARKCDRTHTRTHTHVQTRTNTHTHSDTRAVAQQKDFFKFRKSAWATKSCHLDRWVRPIVREAKIGDFFQFFKTSGLDKDFDVTLNNNFGSPGYYFLWRKKRNFEFLRIF